MSNPISSPISSNRVEDIKQKHERVIEFLEDEGFDALLLGTRENFAWYTSGGNNSLGGPGSRCAYLYVSRDEVKVIVDESHADRIKAEQLSAIDLEIFRIPWTKSPESIFQQFARGQQVACDFSFSGASFQKDSLTRLRMELTSLDRIRYRDVGRQVTHAIEATARNLVPRCSEAEIAGQIANRLIKHQLQPIEIYVGADDRPKRYGRPVYSQMRLVRRCWISAIAERYGLCAGTGRFVCFGKPDPDFATDFSHSAMITAACIYHGKTGATADSVLNQIRAVYRKLNRVEEYVRVAPGCVAGYSPNELTLRPTSHYRIGNSTGLLWRPTIGLAPSCETVMVDKDGYELITGLQQWPQMQIEVAGHKVERPDVLIK